MYTNAPPDQTLTPYSVVINDHYCWLNVLLDTEPSSVIRGPIPPSTPRNIKTSALHSKDTATRWRQCLDTYKVGSGIRLGPEITREFTTAAGTVHPGLISEAHRRRGVIAGLVDHTSSVGQLVGGLSILEQSGLVFGSSH